MGTTAAHLCKLAGHIKYRTAIVGCQAHALDLLHSRIGQVLLEGRKDKSWALNLLRALEKQRGEVLVGCQQGASLQLTGSY